MVSQSLKLPRGLQLSREAAARFSRRNLGRAGRGELDPCTSRVISPGCCEKLGKHREALPAWPEVSSHSQPGPRLSSAGLSSLRMLPGIQNPSHPALRAAVTQSTNPGWKQSCPSSDPHKPKRVQSEPNSEGLNYALDDQESTIPPRSLGPSPRFDNIGTRGWPQMEKFNKCLTNGEI